MAIMISKITNDNNNEKDADNSSSNNFGLARGFGPLVYIEVMALWALLRGCGSLLYVLLGLRSWGRLRDGILHRFFAGLWGGFRVGFSQV